MGMASGKHHGDGAAVRMARDVGLIETKSIHACGYAVGGRFKAGIETGNPLGLAHVEEIDSINARIAREKADVLPPVFRGAHQSMEQQERASRAGALVVDLAPTHQDKRLFDLAVPYSHRSQPFSEIVIAAASHLPPTLSLECYSNIKIRFKPIVTESLLS